MKPASSHPLSLIPDLPVSNELVDILLGQQVDQWLASEFGMGRRDVKAGQTSSSAPVGRSAASSAPACRTAAIVPNAGDSIPDSGQWNSGQ